MYMRIHVHTDVLRVAVSTVHNLCVRAHAVAEWHACQGIRQVVARGGACSKGAKGCVDVEEPCDGEWMAIVVHHDAGQEAT
jgi:hypothetical protein